MARRVVISFRAATNTDDYNSAFTWDNKNLAPPKRSQEDFQNDTNHRFLYGPVKDHQDFSNIPNTPLSSSPQI